MSCSIITKRFDEVFNLALGRTPSRGNQSYWGGSNIWVSISDMSCGKFISSSKEQITDVAVCDTNIPIVKKGTVIMSFKLSIGKVCITDADLYTNEAIMAFSPKSNYSILPDYLYYYLQAYKWEGSNEVVLGVTLNKKNISSSLITFPTSLEEQQRIVSILDAEFAKIDALKENAEKNLQNAKDLFQAVLRKELEPKDGWELTTMDKICELSQGLAINSKTKHLLVGNSDLPLLRIKDLKDGTREIFVNEQDCPQSCRAYPDDIIYTRTGTLGLVFTGMYGVMHNNCFKIQIDRSRVDKAFFIYYLQQSAFKDRIVQLAKRAAQPDITHKLFKEQAFTFPLLLDQVNIVAKISSVEHCCLEVQKNYKKTILLCNDLKQTSLRKAFNGEL